MLTGFTSRDKLQRDNLKVEPTTVQPITSLYQGPNGLPYCGMMPLTASTTTLNATTTDRKTLSFTPALSNALQRGDFVRLTGAYEGYYLPVLSGTTSTCVLAVDLPANISSGTQIYLVRPVPLSVSTTGGTSTNVAEWGGVATSLGQKAESASVPVVLATTQDTAKADGGYASGEYATGIAAYDAFNGLWWPIPCSPTGTPSFKVYADNDLGGDVYLRALNSDPTYSSVGLFTRDIPSRPVQSSDTITAVSDTVQLNVVNYSHLVFSISGTYASVNLIFEASIDGGTVWDSVQVRRVASSTIETISGALTNTTRFWRVSVDAFTHFRARATAWGSGTATIRFSASYQPHDPIIATSDVSLNGGYSTAYIDGTTILQQDTITSFVNVMPAGGWDASAGAFACLPLTNSGATVPVEVTGTVVVSSGTSTLANVACGKIAAASLTGAYQNLLTMGGQGRVLHLYNSTDQPVLFSLDAGTTGSIELDAGESYAVDYVANALIATSSTIQAKYVSVAPSVGSVRAIIARS